MFGSDPPVAAGAGVPVLMYHSISDESTERFRPFTVSPASFAAHLDYLSAAGHPTLTAGSSPISAPPAPLRRRGPSS